MKSKYWKKKSCKRQRKAVISFYYQLLFKINNTTLKADNYAKSCFFFNLPKRQQQFTIWQLNPAKHINFSTGKFLNVLKKSAKFYKRNHKNAATIMMQLKKTYGILLKYIYFLRIRNYNFRQYTFFMKYIELFSPVIYYFQHKQSFIPRFNPRRRIKRRILRLISGN